MAELVCLIIDLCSMLYSVFFMRIGFVLETGSLTELLKQDIFVSGPPTVLKDY